MYQIAQQHEQSDLKMNAKNLKLGILGLILSFGYFYYSQKYIPKGTNCEDLILVNPASLFLWDKPEPSYNSVMPFSFYSDIHDIRLKGVLSFSKRSPERIVLLGDLIASTDVCLTEESFASITFGVPEFGQDNYVIIGHHPSNCKDRVGTPNDRDKTLRTKPRHVANSVNSIPVKSDLFFRMLKDTVSGIFVDLGEDVVHLPIEDRVSADILQNLARCSYEILGNEVDFQAKDIIKTKVTMPTAQ